MATSTYGSNWSAKYPTSTSRTNAGCNLCHSSGGGTELNPYGAAFAQQPHGIATLNATAFGAIESLNSDSDPAGATNLQEITANAQPGWTTGSNNQLFSWDTNGDPTLGLAVTPTSRVMAPAITGGLLDPPAATVNQAPVIPGPPTNQFSWTVNEGALLQFTISATDDGPLTALTFTGGNLPTGATLTDNHNGTATFSWTPSFTQGQTTPYPITITVADAGGLTASQSFTITVGNVNRPPAFNGTAIGNQTATEGQALTLQFSASDPDGDALTFSGSLPAGATLTPGANNTATFSWTPSFTQGQTSPYPVTITVTDPGGLTASQSFTITVGNVNRPPVLSPSPVGDRTVTEGQTLTIAFNASDPDGDLLTYSSSPLPSGASLVAGAVNIASFVWTPTTGQASSTPYPITITVTDPGGLSASQGFNVTVNAPTAVNHAPTVNNPGNKTVTAGQLLSFTITGSDPDAGSTLTFAATGLPAGASLSSAGAFAWTPTAAQASSTPYSVTVTATDNGTPALTSAPVTFTITVQAVVTSPPPTGGADLNISRFSASEEVHVGEQVRFRLSVRNAGTANGSAPATLVGMQNGVQVYNQTITVSAVGTTASTFTFPSYTPTARGSIRWTVTVVDQNPSSRTDTTEVEGGEGTSTQHED